MLVTGSVTNKLGVIEGDAVALGKKNGEADEVGVCDGDEVALRTASDGVGSGVVAASGAGAAFTEQHPEGWSESSLSSAPMEIPVVHELFDAQKPQPVAITQSKHVIAALQRSGHVADVLNRVPGPSAGT